MVHRRALAVRLLARITVGAALLVALSYVPLVQPASARLSQKGILVEPNDAVAGFDKTVDLGVGAEMVGFTWQGETTATIEVRGLIAGSWTEWVSLDGTPNEGPDASTHERHPQVSAGPTWLGHNATTIELRVTSGLAHYLVVHAVDTEPAPSRGSGVKPAGADTPLPFIATRAQWGADESLRSAGPTYADKVEFAVVHHTVNSNSYAPSDSAALVRGIYLYHTQVNGWSDIGYNFLVDRFGQVFEGRFGGINQPVIGAHAGGFNAGSTGVALIGDFEAAPVPDATYQSLRRLLDWKLAYHHINPLGSVTHTVAESDCNCQRYPVGSAVTVPTVSGHMDLDFTDCPGRYMYALLDRLRNDTAMDTSAQGIGQWICQWDAPTDYGPGATSRAPAQDDVFIRGNDGQLWQGFGPNGARGWIALGGYLTSDPDAVAGVGGRVDVVARGLDNAAWHKTWDGLKWGPWEYLGGYFGEGLSIASSGPGNLTVAGCGREGGLWVNTFDGVHWQGWEFLGGIVNSAPDITSDGPGHLDVVLRGVGGGMYRRSYRSGSWGGWQSVGGVMAGGGSAASWGPDRLDVATRGADGGLWANAWSPDGWFGWYPLGGIITSSPDIAAPSKDHLVITARGVDGNYWQRTWDGARWQPWARV